MTKPIPRNARTDKEIDMCFDVMSELRTNLQREEFLGAIRQMEGQGFHLIYLKDDGNVVAVAGYRIAFNLFLGKHLYIDDLVTSQSVRSKGYGETIYNWIKNEAKKAECKFIHLDSAVHRHESHRFYFRQGLVISSFHFREKLDSE